MSKAAPVAAASLHVALPQAAGAARGAGYHQASVTATADLGSDAILPAPSPAFAWRVLVIVTALNVAFLAGTLGFVLSSSTRAAPGKRRRS